MMKKKPQAKSNWFNVLINYIPKPVKMMASVSELAQQNIFITLTYDGGKKPRKPKIKKKGIR